MKLIIKDNVYEVTRKAANTIISQCKSYAKPGHIYALRRGDTIILVNERIGVREYKRDGFKVLKKKMEPLSMKF